MVVSHQIKAYTATGVDFIRYLVAPRYKGSLASLLDDDDELYRCISEMLEGLRNNPILRGGMSEKTAVAPGKG